MSQFTVSRRHFMRMAAGASLSIVWNPGNARAESTRRETISFGLCADVHKDVIHDPDKRLQVFVDDMTRREADFILQLGDFCRPYRKNKSFMDIWNGFKGPRYHVLGNHEIDGGFTWKRVMAYFDMDAPYYAFDQNGYHFVVLHGNEKKADYNPDSGYPRYIGPEQLAWLKTDLASTEQPTFIFSHQRLFAEKGGVENYEAVQGVLEEANREAGCQRVVACFCGHRHMDHHTVVNGIHYVNINSMSYQWVGGKYIRKRFDEATEEAFPWVRYTVPYLDPVYAYVTIHPEGRITIEGKESTYIPPTLADIGHPERDGNEAFSASIMDRALNFK